MQKIESSEKTRCGLIYLETKDFVNEMWKVSEIGDSDTEKRFEENELEGWLTLNKIKDGDRGGFFIPKLGMVNYTFDVRKAGNRVLFLDIEKIEGRR